MTKQYSIFSIIPLVAFAIALICLGFIPQQKDFSQILIFYSLAFLAYIYILKFPSLPIRIYLIIAVALRFLMIFSFPNLSDDIYRFIWDGNLLHAGINPFSHLPSALISTNIEGNSSELFAELNSQNYFSVYPPISQLIFFISTIGNSSWLMSSVIMKLVLFFAEIGSISLIIKMLTQLELSKVKVLIYALNPLIIIELMGNLHFEALTVFFVLLSIYLIINKKEKVAAMALSFGVAAKMLPLMFIGYFCRNATKSKIFLSFFLISTLILFAPLLLGIEIANFGKSLDLYFGKFEFNGSIYILLRFLGEQVSGYNLIRYIGPGMALVTCFVILRFMSRQKKGDYLQLIHFSFYTICLYYFLSTIIHPWYLAIPLALSLFTNFKFVILWTGLIMLSYINYSYSIYQENLWISLLEYGFVFGYLAFELKTKKATLL